MNATPAPFRIDALSQRGVVEVFAQPIEEGLCSPFDEENAFAATLNKRGPHFLAARLAAHAALEGLGCSACAIGRGEGGEPLFPAGVVGSLSHTHGLAVAAVADAGRAFGLGVDVEKRARTLSPGTQRTLCHPEELSWIDDGRGLPAAPLLALVSTKEVVFKTYFPLTRVRLGYHDAIVTPRGGHLLARVVRALPLPEGALAELPVRWAKVGEHLVFFGALHRR